MGKILCCLSRKNYETITKQPRSDLFPNVSQCAGFRHTVISSMTEEIVYNLRSNKPAWLLFRKSICACEAVWGCEGEREACFSETEGGGESFLVSVPAIVMSLWKLMPVVRGQGPLSWVCLYQWKNTHLALGPQSTVRLDHISEGNLTNKEHISSAGGRDKAASYWDI